MPSFTLGPASVFMRERLSEVVIIVLLPIYMTFSGLRTDLTLLDRGSDWGVSNSEPCITL